MITNIQDTSLQTAIGKEDSQHRQSNLIRKSVLKTSSNNNDKEKEFLGNNITSKKNLSFTGKYNVRKSSSNIMNTNNVNNLHGNNLQENNFIVNNNNDNVLNLHSNNLNQMSQIPINFQGLNNNNFYNYFSYNNIFFEFKISNFCEIFNKIIKGNNISINYNKANFSNANANSNSNINNNLNNLQITSNFNQANPTKNHNDNQNTNNLNKKRSIFNNNNNNNNQTISTKNLNPQNINNNNNNNNNFTNIFTFDIQNFFYENNLNYQNFVDLLTYMQNNLNRESKVQEKNLKKNKFIFCIAKCNKTHNISRVPFPNYEIILNPKKFFFILEAENLKTTEFLEDNKFVTEKLNKTPEDIFDLFNFYIEKKIKKNVEIIKNEYGNINTKQNEVKFI